MHPILIIHTPLLGGDDAYHVLQQLRLRGARIVALGTEDRLAAAPWSGRWRAQDLLAALRLVDGDPSASWLACRDEQALEAAASAGLHGVVLVGIPVPAHDGTLVVGHAPDLASVTLAMVPRGGGCWHDQRA